ncbi:MAG: hypothetical protein MJ237_01095 [bacterium]|nr:hypothetical protein [bacterium]
MKKGLCLSLLMLLGLASATYAYSYDTNIPLPGKSIAGAEMQRDTLFTAYAYAHRIAPPDCTSFSIADTMVSKPRQDNKWQEIWTLKACSRTAKVPINFEIKPDYNAYTIDYMNVKVYSK